MRKYYIKKKQEDYTACLETYKTLVTIETHNQQMSVIYDCLKIQSPKRPNSLELMDRMCSAKKSLSAMILI
jgi:hypothetical protein